MAYLSVENLEKAFGGTRVLRDVSFQLPEGETLSVIGSSGSGKTTLLRCLNFLERPDGGVISLRGEPLLDASRPPDRERDLRRKRLHFGLVFQDFNLFPQYTALENVTLARRLARRDGETEQDIRDRGLDLLDQMGLSDRAGHYPHQLSGGQKQRVAIARALCMEPDVLCFDEPTSALDPELTGEVLRVIRQLAGRRTTMIVVTHEMAFARDVADRLIFMDGGVIVEQGDPRQVMDHPRMERTRQFLSRCANTSQSPPGGVHSAGGYFHAPLFLFFLLLRPGQRQRHLEQVAVDGQSEVAALDGGQAGGDGQPQPAALGGPGAVPPDEPLRQLVGGDIQRIPRDILHHHPHAVLSRLRGQIHPCPGHGVFADVAHQVVQHPPQQPPVGHSHRPRLAQSQHRLQHLVLQPLLILAAHLAQQHVQVRRGRRYRYIPRGCLGRLHQVLRQLPQPLGLPVQHRQILPRRVGGHLLLFQQVHIADDGCQRRLDIVGHVGDQLGFQPLGLHFLLHSPLNARLHGVQVSAWRFSSGSAPRLRVTGWEKSPSASFSPPRCNCRRASTCQMAAPSSTRCSATYSAACPPSMP